MHLAGNRETAFGARAIVVGVAAAFVAYAGAVGAQQARLASESASASSSNGSAPSGLQRSTSPANVLQGHVTSTPASPPLIPGASVPLSTSAPERALPGMPVPMKPQVASGASEASTASAASAASTVEPASAASAASEAEAPEVPLPAEPPEPNLAQRHGLPPAGAFAMRQTFAKEVDRRLSVSQADQQAYGRVLQHALDESGHGDLANEFVVLVDRSANVQALMLFFRAKPADAWSLIGASPVSTGRPGTYDHFVTPLGVFQHVPGNMDFRAEGTLNEFKIRGYGARDMRIYDFGWADGERGWGKGGISPMRFQMHATDPQKLEPLLGMRHSKGCVRIPSTLNTFFDHRGILDAQYEARAAEGQSMWILKSTRNATPWAGHFLVVVDTAGKARPAWSPGPGKAVRANIPAGADTAD
ncbi:L,D-transpeptidase [Caballeronia sp. LZ001]|nr:L,D-transpeptidase [Caballeronia sp. LZ001]MDR5800800.1 L,D-transpeptidase [Caballeronia sp. LZ001]